MNPIIIAPGAHGTRCKYCDRPVLLFPKDGKMQGKCKCGQVYVSKGVS